MIHIYIIYTTPTQTSGTIIYMGNPSSILSLRTYSSLTPKPKTSAAWICAKEIYIKKKSTQHGTCGINGIKKFDLPSLHQPGRRAPLTSQRDLMVAEEVTRSRNLNQLQKRHPKRHQK